MPYRQMDMGAMAAELEHARAELKRLRAEVTDFRRREEYRRAGTVRRVVMVLRGTAPAKRDEDVEHVWML